MARVRMTATFDLGDFRWFDPLRGVDARGDRDVLFYPYMAYSRQLQYLQAIWNRLRSDYSSYAQFYDFQTRAFEHRVGYSLSTEEQLEYQRGLETILMLDLDHDSFIIHAKILMDKIGELTALLLRKHPNPPPKSFHRQRQFFLRCENAKYPPNQEYAELVRNTDWFEICLSSARDVMVVHSIPNIGGMYFSSREGKITPLRYRWEWNPTIEAKSRELASLKEKYASKYAELKTIDNYWLLVDFFVNHDLELEKPDVYKISSIIRTTGGYLPDLNILATRVIGFLEKTASAFGLSR